jgi:hypothetical protein
MNNENNTFDDENQKNDDFLSALSEGQMIPQDIIQPKPKSVNADDLNQEERAALQSKLAEQNYVEQQEQKIQSSVNTEPVTDGFEDLQASEIGVAKSEPVVEEKIDQPEIAEEQITISEQPVSTPVEKKVVTPVPEAETTEKEPEVKKHKRSSKKIEVTAVTPEEALNIEHNKNEKLKKTSSVKGSVDILDDFDKKVLENNEPTTLYSDHSEENSDLDYETITKKIDESYEDKTTEHKKEKEYTVEIINEKNPEKKADEQEREFKVERKTVHKYYGGKDDDNISFKLRSAKVSKILNQLSIDDTTAIESTDIMAKTTQERQDIYLKTVLPTLQPSISVVPFIISGVVISMTAFTWPDIQELLKIEDKVSDLDPSTNEYFYEKNKLFLEKRHKQLELFYKHIDRVSGFEVKPSFEDLFGKILKAPDFQQLFFAAYSASFLKEYQFNITCATCGTENIKMINSKDLCFLLNTNININRLNHFIETGSTINAKESAQIYKEFQEEKIVEMSNSTYRVKQKLPVSSFLYDLKIPTILEALDAMGEIVELFKEKDLSYTDIETGNTVYIDSSFGLTPELIELKKYMYIKTLIVPRVIDENKETNKASVSFVNFNEKNAIINSIYNLSPEDYRTLINDENLNKLIKVSGIRHAINAGICEEVTCKSELGSIPVEPEMLFFIIARQEYV